MNYIEELKKYNPVLEQEIVDKNAILQLIDKNENILTRDNKLGHLSASSIILNKDLDKTLVIYHNIYDTWTWTGGHADGNENLLELAIQEAKEETGIKNINPLSEKMQGVDIIFVKNHIKRGSYVNDHLHLNYSYFFIADEEEKLKIKPDENSGVKWMKIDEFLKEVESTDSRMIVVFEKLFKKVDDIRMLFEENDKLK